MLYTIFSFVNNGISFILMLILANYLLPQDYGHANLYNVFVQIVSIIIALGTNGYISAAYFQKSREEIIDIITVVFSTIFAVLFFVSILIIIFPSIFSGLTGIPVFFLWLGLLVSYFQAFINITLDLWRLEEKPISYGIFSVSTATLNFIITLILIVYMNYGWTGRVYAQLAVSAIFFVVSLYAMVRKGYILIKLPRKSIIHETLLFGLPLVPHTISFWLKQGMDRYIINYFYEAADVGLYSFALNFAAIIGIIGTAFNANNSVYIYKNLANGYAAAKSSLDKVAKVMVFLFSGLTFCVFAGTYIFIPIILPQYSGSTVFLLPLCLGALFQCIYLLYVNYLFFYKQTKRLMYVTFTTGILQCILSMWLTRYSAILTAYISASVSLITMCAVYIRSRNILDKVSESEV